MPAAKHIATSATSRCSGPACIPKRCAALRRGQSDDFFDLYCSHGKRSYQIASSIRVGEPDEQGDVLERLSHEYELCVYGLGEVRREWERRDGEGSTGPIVIE